MSIWKKILIILFSSFVGIISNPELPFASDTVMFSDVDRSFETVVVEKPVETTTTTTVSVKTQVATASAPQPVVVATRPTPAPVPQPVSNRINIAGRSLEIVDVASTAVDAGNHVNKFGEKFLYAHNMASTFGVLYNMSEGSTFSVTYGGVVKNYVVSAKVIYAKSGPTTLNLNGTDIQMSVVARARYNGVHYDLSLMTCYGTMYGNGDASHRLVLFASEI